MNYVDIELDAYEIAEKIFSDSNELNKNFSFENVDVKTFFEMLLIITVEGLKKFYGVDSKEGLMFFEVHKEADILHRSECEKLLDTLNDKEKILAEKAALTTAKFMWNFLSGLAIKHKLPLQTAA